MRKRTAIRQIDEGAPMLSYGKWLIVGLLILIVLGIGINEHNSSIVLQAARFNFVYLGAESGRVGVVSVDPVEEKVLVIEYPTNLRINSRSVGEYEIKNLYRLGSYKDNGGEFARRKIQGFMKLPISGYVVDKENKKRDDLRSLLKINLQRAILGGKRAIETNLSRWDGLRLYYDLAKYSYQMVGEEELIRSGIIGKNEHGELGYVSDRLAHYVGKSFFDWGVGKEGATVAIINQSGVDGLGSDIAQFMENMGIDVVMVRSEKDSEQNSVMTVSNPTQIPKTLDLIAGSIYPQAYQVGETSEYRADIVFRVGTDLLELF